MGRRDRSGTKCPASCGSRASRTGSWSSSLLDQDWRIALERSARLQLEELLAEVGVDAVVVLDDGDAPRVVRNVAGSIGADLVVIGRHAGAGILGRLREHAYAIIRESPCPVVSV